MRLRELARSWPAFAVLVLMAIQAALLSPLGGPGEPFGDDLTIHFAEIAHLRRAIAGGDLNLWNPGANLGFPSGYYYQLLPQLLTALASFALGDTVSLLAVFKAGLALPLVLFPLVSFRALRVAGASPGEAVCGAAGASLVSGASSWGFGIDSLFATGPYSQPWATLFYPLALAHGARWILRRDSLGRAFAYALLAGLCHPFIGLAIAPALLVSPWWRAGGVRALGRAAFLGGLLLAATAFVWLPIAVHRDSFGGFPARVGGEDGIPFGTFAGQLVRGDLLDAGRRIFGEQLPVLTLLLVPAFLFSLSRSTLLSALFAQGALFAALVFLGPVVGKMRGDLIPAVRFIAPMQIALGAASGLALARLLRAGSRALAGGGARFSLPLFGSAIVLARVRWKPGPLGRGVRRAASLAGLAAVVALAAIAVSGSLAAAMARVRTVGSFPEFGREELAEILAFLRGRPSGRVYGSNELGTGSHWWLYLPPAEADQPALRAYGGAALQSSPNYVYLREFNLEQQWRLYGVRYVLARKAARPPLPEMQRIFETRRFAVYELPGPSYFAPIQVVGALAGDRVASVWEWLRTQAPARGEHLEIGGAPTRGPPPLGRVLREQVGLSTYAADVECEGATPTTFLLRVGFHPGWRASVDGARAPIRRVSPDMMAVDVPPGPHTLRFAFRRPAWTWLLLLVTLAAAVAARRVGSLSEGPAEPRSPGARGTATQPTSASPAPGSARRGGKRRR